MKRAKTKSSKHPEVHKVRSGSPFTVHAPAPPHRLPGQPLTIFKHEDKSKYDRSFHPESFIKHCQEGHSKFEILSAWRISASTLSLWVKTHPEFKEAYEIGKPAQQAWLARAIRENLNNKTANASLMIFSAKNILGWNDDGTTQFDDVQETEVDFNVGPEPKVGA